MRRGFLNCFALSPGEIKNKKSDGAWLFTLRRSFCLPIKGGRGLGEESFITEKSNGKGRKERPPVCPEQREGQIGAIRALSHGACQRRPP